MKRIIVCCDGTWSKADQRQPTNVIKIHHAIAERDPAGVTQVSRYLPGVGTKPGERILGGAFGWGLSRAVREGYVEIARQYEPGDQIFLFGYSRGAYTARSLGGFIRNTGILKEGHLDKVDQAYDLYRDRSDATRPDAPRSVEFRAAHSHDDAEIAMIGVFDTVGALGLPGSGIPVIKWFNRRWSFHDTDLSRRVRAAFHALAIDEARSTFAPTLWTLPEAAPGQVLEQVWFAGGHSNVGGGNPDTGLSDLALAWMVRSAQAQGLAMRDGLFAKDSVLPTGRTSTVAYRPDPMGPLGNGRTGFFALLPAFSRPIGKADSGRESLSSTAVARHAARHNAEPQNLIDALAGPHRVTEV